MAKALVVVMPEIRHGLCTWHLMQNEIKHLGNLMKKRSHFLSDFKKCMYDYDQEVKFEEAWSELVIKFNVNENNWVKSMYAIKEKWAACHMKEAFTLGMRSTQLSESLNSNFKACMGPNVNVIQFFNHFERVVKEKRYNELICEYEARHKLARLSCRKFETIEILCCHALKVFEANDVKFVPDQYILNRWTRHARNGIIHDMKGNKVVEDPKLSSTRRYRQLCSTMIRLAAKDNKFLSQVEHGTSNLAHPVYEFLQTIRRHLPGQQFEEPLDDD
ncbi:hypothetical protein L6164_000248 [Bauhinia variegata]|uniref:Uncharacterized protein n=1 Tax=Bauhinia variegata TaxID=167791 RepID=A0ACB9Q663_BAUVA|nr:hypothetical protein L6164_000248 [Bauhinia variegata]